MDYRKAQIVVKISYHGTHCLRHGMAALARQVGGFGLDSVMVMTGHKEIKLVDHYSRSQAAIQKETSLHIVSYSEEQLHARTDKIQALGL